MRTPHITRLTLKQALHKFTIVTSFLCSFNFCDPYSSYQRGANENQNKMLRRWFPKGTDFSKISSLRIQEVVDIINEKPRKVLGYMTATEVAERLGIIR